MPMASRAVPAAPSLFQARAIGDARSQEGAILHRARGDYGMLLDILAAIAGADHEDRRRICQCGPSAIVPTMAHPNAQLRFSRWPSRPRILIWRPSSSVRPPILRTRLAGFPHRLSRPMF